MWACASRYSRRCCGVTRQSFPPPAGCAQLYGQIARISSWLPPIPRAAQPNMTRGGNNGGVRGGWPGALSYEWHPREPMPRPIPAGTVQATAPRTIVLSPLRVRGELGERKMRPAHCVAAPCQLHLAWEFALTKVGIGPEPTKSAAAPAIATVNGPSQRRPTGLSRHRCLTAEAFATSALDMYPSRRAYLFVLELALETHGANFHADLWRTKSASPARVQRPDKTRSALSETPDLAGGGQPGSAGAVQELLLGGLAIGRLTSTVLRLHHGVGENRVRDPKGPIPSPPERQRPRARRGLQARGDGSVACPHA